MKFLKRFFKREKRLTSSERAILKYTLENITSNISKIDSDSYEIQLSDKTVGFCSDSFQDLINVTNKLK